MAVKTDQVRELVDFAPEGYIVTSFYLNVDATEFVNPTELQTSVDSLLHQAESDRKEIEESLSHDATESVRSDLEKIREFMSDFDRQDTSGLAIFSCSSQDFWEVIRMPTCIDSRVVFDRIPYVAPLAAFLSHSKPTAVLLTDRQNARIFTMKHGDVREWSSFEDYVPSRSDQGGWSQMRFQRRSDHWAKHHVDHAAELVLRLLQHYPFDWLILGIEPEVQSDLQHDMHPYIKDRVIGEINVRIDAPLEEAVEKARTVREEAEQHLIEDLISQIQEYAGAGGRGTIGLSETLQALNEQKIHILVLQQGLSKPGARCLNCGQLTEQTDGACPACGEPLQQVANVVDAAIQKAFELGSVVEVATEFQQLEPIENIGSIMYY